jgi:hypothetical protein
MWILANGPIEDGLFVCHHCDNPPCFRIEHLFLGTQLDNIRDAKSKHRNCFGETHGRSKLTEQSVREIVKLMASGVSKFTVATLYQIHPNHADRIARGDRWNFLSLDLPERQWASKKKLPQRRDEILSMLNSGMTFAAIGRALGTTGEGVSGYLKRHPPQ